VKFVKSNDLDAFKKAVTPKTRAFYAESIGNPKLDVADLEGISRVAHRNGLPLVLDNTVSPIFCVQSIMGSISSFIQRRNS
jgi:O-acetylhomoserine (thiol)-lyase